MKPSPDDIVERYFDSLKALGIDPEVHDLRLVEDNWESPTLGAWGLGWEVWLNGMEVTQFTYFQQRSEEHTSELQSLMRISYAVFCLKKKNTYRRQITHAQTTI